MKLNPKLKQFIETKNINSEMTPYFLWGFEDREMVRDFIRVAAKNKKQRDELLEQFQEGSSKFHNDLRKEVLNLYNILVRHSRMKRYEEVILPAYEKLKVIFETYEYNLGNEISFSVQRVLNAEKIIAEAQKVFDQVHLEEQN